MEDIVYKEPSACVDRDFKDMPVAEMATSTSRKSDLGVGPGVFFVLEKTPDGVLRRFASC